LRKDTIILMTLTITEIIFSIFLVKQKKYILLHRQK